MTGGTHIRQILFTVFCLILLPSTTGAQEKPAPFSALDAGAGLFRQSSNDEFSRFWSPEAGFRLTLDTPFYIGFAGIGLTARRYTAKERSLPHFRSTELFVSWKYSFTVTSGLTVDIGIQSGFCTMTFDKTEWNQSDINLSESELTTGLSAGVTYSLSPRWHIRCSFMQTRMFTLRRIEHNDIQIGLVRRFRTPAVIREFLK